MLVRGVHSAHTEPLNGILFNTFQLSCEINNTYQLDFTAYDDGSVAYQELDIQSSIFFEGEEYIVKQSSFIFQEGFSTKQINATHIYNEVERIRQRKINEGNKTYTVKDVLDFYLKNNKLGFTYKVIGNFGKQQITDLGNGSGKDCLSKITETWKDAVVFPKNKLIQVFSSEAFKRDLGNRIDYLHDTSEIQLESDSTSIVNQAMVYGKQKDDDKGTYYFQPFLVTNEDSVNKWGLYPGEDISDERFTDKSAIKKYALSQMTSEPTLTIEVTETVNDRPTIGEVRRVEIKSMEFVTTVEVVSFVWHPFDNTQVTSITLNNSSKTILDYQNTNKNNLKKAITNQANNNKKINSISEIAHNAYSSRISGTPKSTVGVKSFNLMTPENNSEMGLNAGEQFYPVTSAENVEGLSAEIDKYIPTLATETTDGLLSSTDKVKLNELDQPIKSQTWTDQVTGKLYEVTIQNGEQVISEVVE